MEYSSKIFAVLLASSHVVLSLKLDVTSPASIKSVASEIAYDMMSMYTGNRTGDTPGNLPAPYYWWEAGAMFGAMIDYWFYTGDSTYNDVVMQAMLHQANSPDNDYKPPNQTKSLGNDDQAFWGMAALSAAEKNFPNPPSTSPQWLALAQAVFNTQAIQYDVLPSTCGGGLRWQINFLTSSYHYKNSISNGCFFNIGARLARYTGNATYAQWAEKTYDWVVNIGLLTPDYELYDGTDETNNCTVINNNRWSYNVAVFLLGAANMYNYTASIDPGSASAAKWKSRTTSLLNVTSFFFSPTSPNIMYETICEPTGVCNIDQRSFKAYLARFLAATTKVAPFTTHIIMPLLKTSAVAAAAQCCGGTNGRLCGQKWTQGDKWDGMQGVGEQMSALEVVQSCLLESVGAPVTNTTGGTSKGDPNAGMAPSPSPGDNVIVRPGDRAGAGIITVVTVVSFVFMCAFMVK